jgi:hypothetical protein
MFKELFTESKAFNPKDFKVGDKVIIHFSTASGNLKEKVPGVVKKIHQNGLSVEKESKRGPTVTFLSDQDDKVTLDESTKSKKQALKKGDKVKYLGKDAVIKSVEEYNGKTYYSVRYKGENGSTTASGILSTNGAITESFMDEGVLKKGDEIYHKRSDKAVIFIELIKSPDGTAKVKLKNSRTKKPIVISDKVFKSSYDLDGKILG